MVEQGAAQRGDKRRRAERRMLVGLVVVAALALAAFAAP
jgi:hypothetical protein